MSYYGSQLDSSGIQIYKSKSLRRCQLCWQHMSRHRRVCPLCERLIAPGCWPIQCWSDELNHCRECHTVIGTLKLIRIKIQYAINQIDGETQDPGSGTISYGDLPIGIQITIMVYLFPTKDLVWSGSYMLQQQCGPRCTCSKCTHLVNILSPTNSPI